MREGCSWKTEAEQSELINLKGRFNLPFFCCEERQKIMLGSRPATFVTGREFKEHLDRSSIYQHVSQTAQYIIRSLCCVAGAMLALYIVSHKVGVTRKVAETTL